MNIFLTFAFLFFLGSTLGWCIELLFRRFVTQKKWLNPGFLIGPYLPLYGFGLCLLYLLSTIPLNFVKSDILRILVLLLLMGISMTAIEYVAGKIFIVGMKVKLWDYSDRKGNVEGIICPLFSFAWTVLGAGYYFLIHPFVLNAVGWLFSNLAFSFIVGMFFGVFFIDLAYSTKLLMRIRQFAAEHEIVVKLEELKKRIYERREKHRFKEFLFSLKENMPFAELFDDPKEQFKEYREKLHEQGEKILQKIKREK